MEFPFETWKEAVEEAFSFGYENGYEDAVDDVESKQDWERRGLRRANSGKEKSCAEYIKYYTDLAEVTNG